MRPDEAVLAKDAYDSRVLPGDFSDAPVMLANGAGVYLYDESGKRYLDAVGGVGVVNLGHGVPEITDAIAQQARRLAFSYGSRVTNQPRQLLAHMLDERAPAAMRPTRSLFSSGGAEANEAAIKLAYQYHWERGHHAKRKVIGRWQSYHGNTLATLSVSGRTAWRRMHDPLLLNFPHVAAPYCYRCPWGCASDSCGALCAEELRRVITQEGPENIAAFIAEPVIGTSMSAVVPPPDYYRRVRDICDEFDILFIADEVMSGVGRTGLMWGIEHWGVAPDIITVAKGIAGGYAPLAATILSEKVWQAIAGGSRKVMHSTTYGGNPLSCAAGVAVLKYIDEHRLVARAAAMGEKLFAALHAGIGDLPCVGDIRGKGLFVGIELVADRATRTPFAKSLGMTGRLEAAAFKNGLLVLGGAAGLIDGVNGDHFELLPPYVIDDEHIHFMVTTVRRSLEEAVAATAQAGRA